MVLTNKNKNAIWYSFVLLSAIIAFVPIVLCIFRNLYNHDSVYYLLMVERIAEGQKLYTDVACGYTPLWFYMMAFIKKIFNVSYGNYEFYLAINFVMQITAALFIYKICRLFEFNKYVSYFVSWWFVMQTHFMEGNIILLEMPSMMFGLAAIYISLAFKDNNHLRLYIIVGIVASCSFLSKQFGLGYVVLCIFLIVVLMENKPRRIAYVLVGFMMPCVLCQIIWPDEFLNIVFSRYGTESASAAGYDSNFSTKIMNVLQGTWDMVFKRYACIVPVSFVFIPLIIKQEKGMKYLFCLCGVFGFMLQFYFTVGVHYLLHVMPFVAILIALLLSLDCDKIIRVVMSIPITIMVLYSIYGTYNNRVRKIYYGNQKEEQIKVAKAVKEIVPEGKTIWIVHGGLIPVYYNANILPPNLSTIGYSFAPLGINEEEAFMQAKSADYVLSYVYDYEYESTYYTPRLKDYVWEHEVEYIKGGIALHDMSKSLKE